MANGFRWCHSSLPELRLLGLCVGSVLLVSGIVAGCSWVDHSVLLAVTLGCLDVDGALNLAVGQAMVLGPATVESPLVLLLGCVACVVMVESTCLSAPFCGDFS